ncbi:MAG: hypothetical protein R2941_23570 [Desulfobacterales bacterium]
MQMLSISGQKSGTNGEYVREVAANAGKKERDMVVAAEGAAGSPAQLEIVQQVSPKIFR